ncbi:amidohydrolase family protein [Amycolatopsis mongoliensis]|uniref:Amidohydrolase family protein n=1 Tax=Amycolatopsis mongoliensis TaxID=715475 RepID=A0A9Y2JP46_9PSEU|nr:amidohydrolase family protein [Amycolatopsis sp. 4-36]WIY00952.1 amidohydrolase family protein [Amycolatopsis sp. 4-36]
MKPSEVEGRIPAPAGEVAVRITWQGDVISEVRRLDPAPDGLPVVAPGLVDLQVNGYGGLDVNAASVTADTVAELSHLLAAHGVTTWLPTIVTAPEERILEALRCVARARAADPVVASAVPAAHVEGPFISDRPGARGVHDPSAVRPMDAGEVDRWLRAGPVGIVTVSPHGEAAPEQVRRLRGLGVTVAIGHTHATPDEITAAVDAGASLSTHLGNGIPTTVPRHPNVLWRQLADDRLSAGLIADGHHLPYDTLEVMLRAKGIDGAFLVSDSTEIGGRPPGRYRTAVGSVVELGEDQRLSEVGSDLLAGAAATLLDGVRTVSERTSFGLAGALALATANPARHVPGIRPGTGELRTGGPADLIVLDDSRSAGLALAGVVQAGRWVLGA